MSRMNIGRRMSTGIGAGREVEIALQVTGTFVALGAPRWTLALTNWVVLIAVIAYGARKGALVPKARLEKVPSAHVRSGSPNAEAAA